MKNLRIHECGIKEQFSDKVRVLCYSSLIAIVLVFSLFISDHGMAKSIVIGSISGLFAHWLMTRRMFIVLTDYSDFSRTKNILRKLKYTEFGNNDHFRLTLPRWMFFDHQDVYIERTNNMITVTGPRYVLISVRKRLT